MLLEKVSVVLQFLLQMLAGWEKQCYNYKNIILRSCYVSTPI